MPITTHTVTKDHAEVRRVLLIAPYASYRTVPFVQAAQALGVEVVIASHDRGALVAAGSRGVHIDMGDVDAAMRTLLAAAQQTPFAAVMGTDDASTELAARVCAMLGLAHNPPAAVQLARRKDLARACLTRAGVMAPRYQRIDLRQAWMPQCAQFEFPCVVKPVALSASRGVIRANNPQELECALGRVQRLLATVQEVTERDTLLVEAFIPGIEVAVEGLLTAGDLTILAIFDKPDSLDGPYFEETYYITPSRLSAAVQQGIAQQVGAACRAYGLRTGPIHAECRINSQGVWILEVAARTIGGLCARLLRFGTGYGLEELVLTHALGFTLDMQTRAGAAGVLMIPTPAAGILRRVEGLRAAEQVAYIDEVVISVRVGNELVPLPEGASYLGFIFSHAPTPTAVEAALRAAHACLNIVVAPLWKGRYDTRSL